MVERSKLNIITSRLVITTVSITTARLLAWRNWRTIKQGAKMAAQTIMHPAKTIKKVVQKARAGVTYATSWSSSAWSG